MSTIYNLEPQPTASVILHTTQGELSVELFAKQTPITCRNFLQLCLDGYYDGTIFHRLVAGFILQGGDPTGTGNGGESIYDGGAFSGDLEAWPMDQRYGKNAGFDGIGFKDEFHSRLKFNRRGLVGMANEGQPDTNGSQFFFTLGKTEELNGKNTLFGRIAGDTIYNLAKMGEAEFDETTERPHYPAKISRVEILVNPFEDMKSRKRSAPERQKPVAVEKKKKRKGGKNLLSFGDEEGDVEEAPILKKTKFDTRIVMDVEEEQMAVPERPRKSADKSGDKKKGKDTKAQSMDLDHKNDNHRLPATSPPPPSPKMESKSKKQPSPEPRYRDSSPEDEASRRKTALEKANDEIAALKASMRRNIHSEPAKEERKSALEKLIPENSIRGRKRRPGGNNTITRADKMALDMLKAFQDKLSRAAQEEDEEDKSTDEKEDIPESGKGKEEEVICDLHFIANCESCQWHENKEEGDDKGWATHKFVAEIDRRGKDLNDRKKEDDDLVVIDPRARARTLKEEKRAEREARAGNSGRAWDQGRDQARNAQMARASAFAGRGAK
jgi:peptidyl-prolyl cis-trans isomerase SDCCAG10